MEGPRCGTAQQQAFVLPIRAGDLGGTLKILTEHVTVMLRKDTRGQMVVLRILPIVILLALIVLAAWQFSAGCIGTALFLAGILSILLGVQGTGEFGYGVLKIAGPTGFVLMLVGAVFYAFITGC